MLKRFAKFFSAVVAVGVLAGCAAKPCEAISETADVKSRGLVLSGGRLCRDEGSVATVDYPEVKESALPALYTTAFSKDGWTTTAPDEHTLYFTKGDDALFIVTAKSRERRVPFAIVRYCREGDDSCPRKLKLLAEAMDKNKK